MINDLLTYLLAEQIERISDVSTPLEEADYLLAALNSRFLDRDQTQVFDHYLGLNDQPAEITESNWRSLSLPVHKWFLEKIRLSPEYYSRRELVTPLTQLYFLINQIRLRHAVLKTLVTIAHNNNENSSAVFWRRLIGVSSDRQDLGRVNEESDTSQSRVLDTIEYVNILIDLYSDESFQSLSNFIRFLQRYATDNFPDTRDVIEDVINILDQRQEMFDVDENSVEEDILRDLINRQIIQQFGNLRARFNDLR